MGREAISLGGNTKAFLAGTAIEALYESLPMTGDGCRIYLHAAGRREDVLPDWAQSPQELGERWQATCRKRDLRKQTAFFVSLGWGARLCKLFAVACTRAAFGKRLNRRSQALLDLVERRADDPSVEETLLAEVNAIYKEIDAFQTNGWPDRETERNGGPVLSLAYHVACQTPVWAAGSMASQRRHSDLFGRILKVMIGPRWTWKEVWRTDTVVALARGAYEARAWEHMAILADALEEAGCVEGNLLTYCRGEGPFFRGCRVLDAILAKSDSEPGVIRE
jgi:hypothetical protein